MSRRADPVAAWAALPGDFRESIAGLTPKQLDLRGGSEGWSMREYIHHLVEANLVASTIVIAALGKPGCTYDWSWVNPDAGWMKRLGYGKAPVEPAIALLEALCARIAGVVRSAPDNSAKQVRLRDSAGARPYARTVREVLREECDHARHHLGDVVKTRAAHGLAARPKKKKKKN